MHENNLKKNQEKYTKLYKKIVKDIWKYIKNHEKYLCIDKNKTINKKYNNILKKPQEINRNTYKNKKYN